MPNPDHHPNCPRCKGEGFYLAYEGQGYMRDGSFEHNRWDDCYCRPEMTEDQLPKSLIQPEPTRYIVGNHPKTNDPYYLIIYWSDKPGKYGLHTYGRPKKITTIGLDGID